MNHVFFTSIPGVFGHNQKTIVMNYVFPTLSVSDMFDNIQESKDAHTEPDHHDGSKHDHSHGHGENHGEGHGHASHQVTFCVSIDIFASQGFSEDNENMKEKRYQSFMCCCFFLLSRN